RRSTPLTIPRQLATCAGCARNTTAPTRRRSRTSRPTARPPGLATATSGDASARSGSLTMLEAEAIDMTVVDEKELRSRLTPLQYSGTRGAATRRPFPGAYVNNHEPGFYRCIVCHEPLFDSGTKFESGTGWPSFYDVISQGNGKDIHKRLFGM